MLGEVEDVLHLLHRLVGHSLGLTAGSPRCEVYLRRLAQHVGLVECVHDVGPDGHRAVFLPEDDVVAAYLLVVERQGDVREKLMQPCDAGWPSIFTPLYRCMVPKNRI